eukprot:12601263-Ditylum_brightwellii.AAC.1
MQTTHITQTHPSQEDDSRCTQLVAALTQLANSGELLSNLHSLLLDSYSASGTPLLCVPAPAPAIAPAPSQHGPVPPQDPSLPLDQRFPPKNNIPMDIEALLASASHVAPAPAPKHQQQHVSCTTSRLGCPKCSQWEFYAIQRGLKSPQLNTTWDTACLKFINPTMDSPFLWSKFQGFQMYEEVATYLGRSEP